MEDQVRIAKELRKEETHTNIVSVLNSGALPYQDTNSHFIDMELCDATLVDYIAGGGIQMGGHCGIPLEGDGRHCEWTRVHAFQGLGSSRLETSDWYRTSFMVGLINSKFFTGQTSMYGNSLGFM